MTANLAAGAGSVAAPMIGVTVLVSIDGYAAFHYALTKHNLPSWYGPADATRGALQLWARIGLPSLRLSAILGRRESLEPLFTIPVLVLCWIIAFAIAMIVGNQKD